jgi:hypothetical protein
MARAKHEIRLDLSGVDLAALRTDGDFVREARKLLPAALEDLGQAMAEVAWDRQPAAATGPPVNYRRATEKRKFILDAGRKYRRHAPAEERQALEDLITRQLWAAKSRAAAATTDGGSTLPPT